MSCEWSGITCENITIFVLIVSLKYGNLPQFNDRGNSIASNIYKYAEYKNIRVYQWSTLYNFWFSTKYCLISMRIRKTLNRTDDLRNKVHYQNV
jgi:hypothetical protein